MPNVERVLELFTELNTIPRCSKNEERVASWLLEWAENRGFATRRDTVGNVLISVPGAGSGADQPPVVIQGHMDMVCEKSSESSHSFQTDAIPVITDGDWIHAQDTTLGADNGIAVALALAAAESDLSRPPLEILITVDEETGLTGAQGVQPEWLSGRQLLNIDSEDEGVFTVGCAGGQNTFLTLPVAFQDAGRERVARVVVVSGLKGGHSGVEIHLQRANANVLLTRFLQAIQVARVADGSPAFRLASFSGGSAHNAIPRDARAVLTLADAEVPWLAEFVTQFQRTLQSEYAGVEPNLKLSLQELPTPDSVMSDESATRLLDLLAALPDGVERMSSSVEGLVETSTNLATVTMKDGVEIGTSQRSSFSSRLAEIAGRIEAAGRLAGAGIRVTSRYQAWEPDMESSLLERCRQVYTEQFSTEPVVEVIHAGLECGVIGAKYPGMEMISFGPTIRGAHSPEERLQLSSLQRIWTFLTGLLASYTG